MIYCERMWKEMFRDIWMKSTAALSFLRPKTQQHTATNPSQPDTPRDEYTKLYIFSPSQHNVCSVTNVDVISFYIFLYYLWVPFKFVLSSSIPMYMLVHFCEAAKRLPSVREMRKYHIVAPIISNWILVSIFISPLSNISSTLELAPIVDVVQQHTI